MERGPSPRNDETAARTFPAANVLQIFRSAISRKLESLRHCSADFPVCEQARRRLDGKDIAR